MKSGFPLQLEISSILRRRSYEVTNGVYFFDEDEKKARELDVEAGVPIDLTQFEDDMWQFNPWAIIECKKSRVNDWVFFNSEPPALHFDIGHSIDILTEKSGYDKSICCEILRNTGVHYYAEDQKYAGAYEQVRVGDGIKKEKDGKDAILDATSKIVKFTNYRFQHLKRFFTEHGARRDIIFNFPIVVFEGDLYEASFEKTLDLKECQHIIYETRYLSALSGSLEPLYIDIVRKDALEEVLSVIEKEVASINRDLAKPRIQRQLSEIFEKRIGNR